MKLVKMSDIVVVEPAISAAPDLEQAPAKLEYEQPILTVLRTSYGLAISRLEVSVQWHRDVEEILCRYSHSCKV